MSKAEYEANFQQVGNQLAPVSRLKPPVEGVAQDAQRLRAGVRELAKLKPPEKVAMDNGKLVSALRSLLTDYKTEARLEKLQAKPKGHRA